MQSFLLLRSFLFFQDDLMSSEFSRESEREKGGQITLQQQSRSPGLCECVCVHAWGTGQLGHTHHTRAMRTGWWSVFSTGSRPPRQIKISYEQAVLYLSMCWIKCGARFEVQIDGCWIEHTNVEFGGWKDREGKFKRQLGEWAESNQRYWLSKCDHGWNVCKDTTKYKESWVKSKGQA